MSVQFVVTATQTITNSDYGVSADGVSTVGQVVVMTTVTPGEGDRYKVYLPVVVK
jgi:hypothetical protein